MPHNWQGLVFGNSFYPPPFSTHWGWWTFELKRVVKNWFKEGADFSSLWRVRGIRLNEGAGFSTQVWRLNRSSCSTLHERTWSVISWEKRLGNSAISRWNYAPFSRGAGPRNLDGRRGKKRGEKIHPPPTGKAIMSVVFGSLYIA